MPFLECQDDIISIGISTTTVSYYCNIIIRVIESKFESHKICTIVRIIKSIKIN